MKQIIIIGAGGFAREVAWLIEEINAMEKEWEILGYVDEDSRKHGIKLNNYEVLGGLEVLNSLPNNVYLICAIGDPRARKSVIERVHPLGFPFANLVHPDVKMSSLVFMGQGNIVCSSNILTVNINIGNHNIINLACTIGHDVIIKDYCTLFPGVNVSGNVVLNNCVYVGTNTSIIQGISIGEETIIGAGSVVIRDLPSRCTAVGVPAKPIKFHGE